MTNVLDASAVLAFVYAEAGHQVVEPLLDGGRISAANWSEVMQKIAHHGGDPIRQATFLIALGLVVEPLTQADAVMAARLYPVVRAAGLSLGDRCCLALAYRLGAPAITADKAWAELDLDVAVRLIR